MNSDNGKNNNSGQNDMISVAESKYYSTLKTKSIIETPRLYDKKPKLTSVPEELKMDFSRVLGKPFLVSTMTWKTSDTVGTNVGIVKIPTDILTNALARIPFVYSSLYRLRGCLQVQVSGTPMHQGTLLCGVVPADTVPFSVTSLLQAPHTFLHANESTASCVEVPFYTPLTLEASSTIPGYALTNSDYAAAYFRVVNQLAASTTGSTSLSVTVHIVLWDAEFYVPRNGSVTYVATAATDKSSKSSLFSIPTKIFDGLAQGAKTVTGDLIDSLRSGLRTITGFHNPNSTTIDTRMITTARNFGHNVDQPTLMEKMDQHAQFDRINSDYTFSTSEDEMLVKNILRKPAYLGKFVVNDSNPVGTLLCSQPISPYIEGDTRVNYSPMRLLYEASRYWRGGLKLHIQSNMTNFHFCKLLVAKSYDVVPDAISKFIPMNDALNLCTDTLEFSAGGQVQTVSLPYCSRLDQLECTKYFNVNGAAHGHFYIYLLQPLVSNGSVPASVEFNVYMTADDDFQFYGYASDPLIAGDAVPTIEGETTLPEVFVPEAEVDESETPTTVGLANQTNLMNNQQKVDSDSSLYSMDFKPMVSIRDYVRRIVPVFQRTYTPTTLENSILAIPIHQLLGVWGSNTSPNRLVSRLFYGNNGGFKFKVYVTAQINGTLFYVPPGWRNSTDGIRRTIPALNGVAYNEQSSMMRIPAVYTGNVTLPSSLCSIEVPTYSQEDRGNRNNNVCVYEFVIPNMSPFKFVANNYPSTASSDYNKDFSRYDYGTIVYQPNAVEDGANATVSIMMGATDESRLGFQVLSPGFVTPVRAGSGTYRLTNFTDTDGTTNGPAAVNTTFTKGYYFKTT